MVRNYISNDIDLVQPTQYPISENLVAKRPPPEPEPLPAFEPLLKTFSDIVEQLTACICTSLISAHGSHFIEHVYLCKG